MDKGYFTVKEFAEKANISQQAVYKQINGRLKPYIHNVKGQKVIEAAAFKKFYSTEVQQPNNPDSTPEIQDFKPEDEQLNSTQIQPDNNNQKQQELEQQIKELQGQLKQIIENEQEEKQFLRDQIKQKDKQIESLTDNLKIAQQLAAADKKKVLELEAKQEEIRKAEVAVSEDSAADPAADAAPKEDTKEQEQPKRKGIFARLFKYYNN